MSGNKVGDKLKLEYHATIKTGDVFGKWTVLDNKIIRKLRTTTSKTNTLYLSVRCECGEMREMIISQLTNPRKFNGCLKCTRPHGNRHYKWEGVGTISASVLYGISQRARRNDGRQLEVNVTLEYLWELFEKQNKKCALSGIELDMWISNNRKQGRRMSASLDRIDSNKGYIIGNVQWVHKDVNRLKWDLTEERLIYLCKRVAEHNA